MRRVDMPIRGHLIQWCRIVRLFHSTATNPQIASPWSGLLSACNSFLNSRRRFIRRTRNRRATPARRNPPITSAQNFHHPGNLRNPCQRSPPPDLSRQRHRRIRPSILAPIAQQKFHFQHQFFARQTQQRPHAWILQRRQRQSPLLQNRC